MHICKKTLSKILKILKLCALPRFVEPFKGKNTGCVFNHKLLNRGKGSALLVIRPFLAEFGEWAPWPLVSSMETYSDKDCAA